MGSSARAAAPPPAAGLRMTWAWIKDGKGGSDGKGGKVMTWPRFSAPGRKLLIVGCEGRLAYVATRGSLRTLGSVAVVLSTSARRLRRNGRVAKTCVLWSYRELSAC